MSSGIVATAQDQLFQEFAHPPVTTQLQKQCTGEDMARAVVAAVTVLKLFWLASYLRAPSLEAIVTNIDLTGDSLG